MAFCLGHGLSHFISLPIIFCLSLQLFIFPFRSKFSIHLYCCLSFHHHLSLLQTHYQAWDSARIPGPDGELSHHILGHLSPVLVFSPSSSLSVHRAEPRPLSTGVSSVVPWHRDPRTCCCPHSPPHYFSPLQRSLQGLRDLIPLYRKSQAFS